MLTPNFRNVATQLRRHYRLATLPAVIFGLAAGITGCDEGGPTQPEPELVPFIDPYRVRAPLKPLPGIPLLGIAAVFGQQNR